jgi:hypothetical protein
MYSGNFWWVRHDRLFGRDWKRLGEEVDRWSVEFYLGHHLPKQEAANLYGDPGGRGGHYDKTFASYACKKCGRFFEARKPPVLGFVLHTKVRSPCCEKAGRFLGYPEIGAWA